MNLIPHSKPTLGREELESIANVISTGHLAQGKLVEAFERGVADFIGVKGGVALSSGTAALHLALLALNIGEGDEVIIPDFTCTALLNAVMYARAIPIVADIIPKEYCIAPEDIKKKLTKKTKAIIVVHPFGLPADIKGVKSIGLPVIEDAAQAIGADCSGMKVGSLCELSVVSFYATKVMTTGEGGMVLSNSTRLLERIRDLRDYDEKRGYKVRFNYKMTDIEAAIGLIQLKKLPEFVEKRRRIAYRYNDALKSLPISLPLFPEERGHIYHRYIVEVNKKGLIEIIRSLKDMGVEAKRPVYKLLHKYLCAESFANSLKAWRQALSIPIYPSLTDGDIKRIVGAVKEALKRL